MATHTSLSSLFTDIADKLRDKGCEPNGFEWAKSSMPTNIWSAVCYGGGKFVAVGRRIVAYSADGINWARSTLPVDDWSSVCYGNDKFVAVSEGGLAVYSFDGVNWTLAEVDGYPSWVSVCYGNGAFVGITAENNAFISTDGTSWTYSVSLPITGANSICYGGGKFVVVCNEHVTACSEDGVTWEAGGVNAPAGMNFCSVCYGDGKFVAVGYKTAYFMFACSTDGINWESKLYYGNYPYRSVCYGDGMFVTVGGMFPAYSTDGINWENSYVGTNVGAVCFGKKKFVAVCGSSEEMFYATTGLTADNFPTYIEEMNGLNIAYGNTPPTDTSKLWIPLATKPSNVEISMDSLESAVDSVATKTAVLPTATAAMTSVEIDGKIYIFGGAVSATRTQILVYDPATDTITTAKRTVVADDGSTTEEDVVMPANSYYAAAVAINGKAYIFGGSTYLTTIYEFDPVAGTVTKKSALADGVHYASAVAINGKAYIFGGQITSSSYTAMIQEYDPATDTCVDTGVDLAAKTNGTTAVAINGKAYIFGGYSYLDTIQEYDPSTNTIKTKDCVLLDGIMYASAVAINGKAYIFGGQIGNASYTAMIQEYDPITDTITEKTGVLAVGLAQATASVANGKAYIFGGTSGSNTDTIQEYTMKHSLPENNVKLTATAVASGGEQIVTTIVNNKTGQVKMHILSAYIGDADGYAAEQTAYVYNTTTGAWQDLAGIPCEA